VNNRGSALVILGLGDPHLLEGGERGKNGASNPNRVLALRWRNDLDLHCGRGKRCELLGETLSNSIEHGRAARENNVGVKVLADVHVALHDGLEHGVVDTGSLLSDEGRLEKNLGATEALIADGDDVAVWELIGLLNLAALCGSLHLGVKVKGNICELLLDVADNFTLSRGGERIASLSENLHQVVGQVAAGKVKTHNGVWERISLIDRNSVCNTVTRVKNRASGAARCIERENGLDVNIHCRHVEGLKHDLGHALSVGLWVEWGLSEENRVLLRCNTELIVEGVVPDLLHVVPVGHNTVLDGVLEGQDTSLALCLIANIGILLVHANLFKRKEVKSGERSIRNVYLERLEECIS
jgi:hypothetical protein